MYVQERAERGEDQELIAAFRAGLHGWTGQPDGGPDDLAQAIGTLRAPSLLSSTTQIQHHTSSLLPVSHPSSASQSTRLSVSRPASRPVSQ